MTFPTIPTSGAGRIVSSANTSPAGTHTFPNLNTLTKNAGDLLIAICITYDGNSTNAEFSSWGASFTEFVDQATTATMGIGAAYKISTGSETGTFTVTTADTSTNDSQCIIMSIPGTHAATAPEGGTIVNGTGAAANIASLNPAGWGTEDTLWIAVCGAGEDNTTGSFTAPSAAPTNYGNLFATAVSADVAGGVYGALAFRQLNAASDDPATFTVDTTNARNSALLIAVRADIDATVTPATLAATVTIPLATAGQINGPTRQFDGTDDVVIAAVGSGGMASLPTGATTIAALAKRTTDGTWDTLASFEASGGTDAWAGIQIRDSTNTISHLGASNTGTPDSASTGGATWVAADGWCVVAVTKASGDNQTPRTHKVVISTGTPTHTNASTTHDNGSSISGGRLQFGRWTSSDFLGGHLAMVAAWDNELSDADIESLAVGLQEWIDLAPTGLWQFRQASTSTPVTDDIADADETSLTGTTVAAAEGPSPFDWDLSAGATVTPSPVACVAALPQPGVGVGVAPAVAATSVTLPAAGVGVGVTKAPVASVAALPQPGVGVGVTKAPVAAVVALPLAGIATHVIPTPVAVVVALPQIAVGVGVTKAPVASVAALPQTAVGVGVTPAATTLVATLPLATAGQVATGATVTPDPLAALATLPQTAVGVGVTKAPVASVVAIPQTAVGIGATPSPIVVLVNIGVGFGVDVGVVPVTVPAVVALPQATPDGGGSSVTRTPDPLAAVAVLPQAAVGIGVTKAPVAAVVALPQTAVGIGVTKIPVAVVVTLPQTAVGVGVAPAVAALVAALPQATVGVGVTKAPVTSVVALPQTAVGVGVTKAPVAAVIALPQATPSDGGAGAIAQPATLTAVASLLQPGVAVGVTKAPVTAIASLPLAAVAVHAFAQPAPAALVASIVQPAVSIGVVPAAVALFIAVLLPERVGPPSSNNINPAGPLLVGLIVVETDAVVGATSRPGGMLGGIG